MTVASQERQKQAYNHAPGLKTGKLVGQGVVGGFVAGISFIIFEMSVAWLLDGNFFVPLRMIAAMLVRQNALEAWYSLFAASLLGLIILVFFSVLFGMLFGYAVSRHPDWAVSRKRLVLAASGYGCILWLINYYVIAPLFGWVWFPLATHPLLQGFIGHTCFFGTVLGLYFARRLPEVTA